MSPKNNADSQFIWMNGELTPYEKATVPVLSHSLHYGTGAFEGIRAYQLTNGKTAIFRGPEHFERFNDSVRSMGIENRYSVTELMAAAKQTIQANGFKECYIRPLAYLDDAVRGLKLPEHPQACIAIATWQWGKYMGSEGQKNGVRIGVSSLRRQDVSSSLPCAKLTGNYITSVMARREATHNGFDEALLLDPHGFVAEGSGENLFMVKNKQIFTPHKGFILPGITRDCAIQIARALGFPVQEANISRNELYLADELFFTGTAAEITPIRELDHYKIGTGQPGPVTLAISDAFFKCTKGENPQFERWLTAV